jgi:ubiquinone/menaquinone biosynthesis C-methylase UbiE
MNVRPMPSAFRYDLKLLVASRGRERRFRERELDLAGVTAGDRVLDVGCGTGTLAIAAARRVGPTGAVHGVDPSEDLLARARKKARRASVAVEFAVGSGDALPFPDASFDVVLSTLVWHHLPHEAVKRSALEVRRVLRPSARFLLVDIGGAQDSEKKTLHAPHGGGVRFDLAALAPRLEELGLRELASGSIDSEMPRLERLHYVLAARAG